ncbi:conserved hypothetical protein [Histoplasma capsulatum var. duboisii H88]|uniref:Endosomal SPRY domain-containing protein n=2 Tax=Ajellomyces capsulatus TaxID=5037 RepID=F0UJK6_AJEC8|nr:conserved hypothetical protein [Histoplasma capsulatum H143]EGC46597.1 conserved hypothetical protein [Histoplasma capsulatum var. duboisii H88]QSS57217.1 hypothetical protein I7I53_05631 [Histoplasma capsulatum var. duboisii H88]
MAPFSPNAREVSGDYLTTLVKRTTSHNFPISQLRQRELSHRITEIAHPLAPRAEHDSNPVEPSRGIVNPTSINMGGLLALFAIIGAAFVLAGIWFFFWAKNGGFVWRKGDWEEYKSTVLRRKDSDGRTLSNATKSTALGGGSVVGKGYGDYQSSTDAATTVDGTVVSGEKPRRKGIRETAKEKLLRRRRDEEWEGGADEDMRAYRHEKPAKVGGLNREPDGEYHSSDYTTSNGREDSEWGQSQAQTHSDIGPLPGHESDRHHSQRQRNASGFSFTTGEDDVMTVATEEQRLHDHAPPLSSRHHDSSHHRRHQHRSSHGSDAPSTSTRPRGPRPNAPAPAPASNRSRQSSPRKRERTAMPGSYAAPLDIASSTHGSDYTYEQVSLAEPDTGTGTRSYHHPIPGLSKGYRRADDGGRGGGGGRGRRDSLSDSEGEDYDSRVS